MAASLVSHTTHPVLSRDGEEGAAMHPSSYRDVITAATAPLVEAILAREAEPEAHVKRALAHSAASVLK